MVAFETLADALDWAARGHCEIGFIDGANDERRLSCRLLSRAAMRLLAVLQADGATAGEPLILCVADNLRFVQFFWAAIYGGLVPVPIAAGTTDAHLEKLVNVWRHLEKPRVIAQPVHAQRLRAYLEKTGDDNAGRALAARTISDEPPAAQRPAERAARRAHDIALIQFSSGSTGDPKGVVLTHANVLANIHAIGQGSRFGQREAALSWMPLTHDMGLIGFHLTFVCHGFNHFLMASDVFARRPLLWLKKAAEKKATLLSSPNFGLRHTLRAIDANGGVPALDLSAVRLIYNGAEPVSAALARAFSDALAPTGLKANALFPVYGLAEASLAATFPRPGAGLCSYWVSRGALGLGDRVRFAGIDDAIELVGLGAPVAGIELRIADAAGYPAGDDTVGRVWIRGANVTAGYYANPAANAQALAGDGWVDSGDLGFIHDSDLVITGRAKEIIFVNGQNHYPRDIEAIAEQAVAIDARKVAAAGVRAPGADADELVLFVVFRGAVEDFAPIARELARRVNQHTGIAVARVLPVACIPKTTSGKPARLRLARDYAQGALADVAAQLDTLLAERAASAASQTGTVVQALQAICDEVAPAKKIGPRDDLFEAGLSSLDLAQIHEGIEARWPDRLALTDLFDYPTLSDLAAFIQAEKI